MNRIRVIEPEEATGRLKEIYDDLVKKRGKLADVHKIQSLRPESIVHHMALYMEIMFTKSELSRAEREMMAVVVSVSNGCEYCQMHHAQALNHYWKNDEKISLLKRDFHQAGLSLREIALCEMARKLTISPDIYKDEQQLQPLRNEGISDNALLDATLVVAYFNFVNRIVLALGLEVTESEMQGYNY
ncbi:peroxidase-related enzyme [Prolixibacter sp. NT017]|uniref:peroxidase-related enzyme n=1 Tax=Prolixibacter sp. NT017 TaxID=2652390 RepID=UPI001274CAEF|nr:peroxidase-related enzyme [Prolixibacter sp. NT017]GET24365.1 alkyl hydroperoxide reductase AhpD [Prolixibacter sp. NT017]